MAQLTTLKRESARRNRSRSVTVALALVALVVGAGWIVSNQPWHTDRQVTPGRPTPSTSGATSSPLTQPQAVGAGLHAGLRATAAPGWTVDCDCDFVWLSNYQVAGALFIAGPITQVWDPVTHRGVAPPSDYTRWLRIHPWLDLVSDSTTVVDGQLVHVLKMRVPAGSPIDTTGQLAKVDLVGQPWVTVTRGDTFTEAVLHIGARTMLVRAFGADTPAKEAALQSALLNLLHSIHHT